MALLHCPVMVCHLLSINQKGPQMTFIPSKTLVRAMGVVCAMSFHTRHLHLLQHLVKFGICCMVGKEKNKKSCLPTLFCLLDWSFNLHVYSLS